VCVPAGFVYSSTSWEDFLFDKARLSLNHEELEDIYQSKLNRGIKNSFNFSSFLLRTSEKYLAQGEIEKAKEYAEYAQLLSPSYPPVYTHLGKIYWTQNRFLFFSIPAGWLKSFSVVFVNYIFSVILLSNILLFFLLSLLLTIATFSIISVYKYFKLLIHDLHHLLSLKLPSIHLVLWGVLIFFLPFFFHWSIFLVFFFWLMLLFIYHSNKEQFIIIFFAFFLLTSPFLIQLISQCVMTLNSGVFYQLYQVNEECWDEETKQRLDEWIIDNPSDADALFSLALIKKREGNYQEATRYYNRVLDVNPEYHKAICNLGNVLLAKKEVDLAIKEYTRCLEICPTSVKGYYNISRAYLLNYMFPESKNSFNKAKELDSESVDYFSRIYAQSINRMVIDETIPLSTFWRKTFNNTEEKTQFGVYLWDQYFRGVPFAYWYSVLFVFLLFVCLLFVNHHESGFSVGCKYCGSVVCRKCRRSIYEDMLCSKCAAIFKSKEDHSISIREKEKKVIQIEKFNKRYITIGRLLSILLPGAGHLWAGYALRGAGLLFLLFFALLQLTFSNGIVKNPWLMRDTSSYTYGVMLVCFLFIIYSYSILNFQKVSYKMFQFQSLIRVSRQGLQIKR